MKPLRHPNGRFRAVGPIAEMPTFYRAQGDVDLPSSAQREAIGLRLSDLPEYARTHLPEARYRDFIAGLRDGATTQTGQLL